MLLQLQFTAAVSAVLTAAVEAGTIAPLAILGMAGTPPDVTPACAVLVEGFASEHPHLHRGTLLLRHRHDADLTEALAAARHLAELVDYLRSEPGRAALDAALAPAGIWLRILTDQGSREMDSAGGRVRELDHALPFWLQTTL